MPLDQLKQSEADRLMNKLQNVIQLFALDNGFKQVNYKKGRIELIGDRIIVSATIRENTRKQKTHGTTNKIS